MKLQKLILAILLVAAVVVSGCVGSETETNASQQVTASQSGFAQIDELETQISDKADEVDAIRDKIDRRSISLLTSSIAALDELLLLNSDLQKNLYEFNVLLNQERKVISDMQSARRLNAC